MGLLCRIHVFIAHKPLLILCNDNELFLWLFLDALVQGEVSWIVGVFH